MQSIGTHKYRGPISPSQQIIIFTPSEYHLLFEQIVSVRNKTRNKILINGFISKLSLCIKNL